MSTEPSCASTETGRAWSWRELRWATGYAAVLAVLTTVPYVWALVTQPYGWQYLGFVYNPDEPNVHLSWIRQAREGAVFFRNEFTSEPHTGHFFNLFMLGLGRLARLLHLSPYAVWAGARVVAAFLLCAVIYAALIAFTRDRRMRRLGLLVVTLSSGLGWLAVSRGLGLDSADVEPGRVIPEGITFLTMYLNPLFAVSMVLLLGGMLWGARGVIYGCWGSAALAGACGLLLGNIHTYDTIPMVLVLAAWLAFVSLNDRSWSWRRCGCLVLTVAMLAPAVLYQRSLIVGDALYAAKANTPTLSPSLLEMAVTYGLLWPFAAWGAVLGWRQRHRFSQFLAVWVVVQFACCYLPSSLFPFQRKMVEGFHLALALLATPGVAQVVRRVATAIALGASQADVQRYGHAVPVLEDVAVRRRFWTPPLASLCVLLLALSNLHFVFSTLDNLRTNDEAKISVLMPPFRLPAVDMEAIAWMRENVPHDGVILCMPLVGNYLPGLIGRTVYAGHWAETIDYAHKLGQYATFMKGEGTADAKARWLRDNGIGFVYYGWYEHLWTNNQRPQLPCLERVYPPQKKTKADLDDPPVQIFRVKPESDAAVQPKG